MLATLTGLILIVDDTPTNLDVISEALSNAGFDVAIATSGERALQQIERKLPDLILLDIMMPGIDGFETCRRLKANQRTCEILICRGIHQGTGLGLAIVRQIVEEKHGGTIEVNSTIGQGTEFIIQIPL